MTTEAKVCLVTGASRGIGAAISDQLGSRDIPLLGRLPLPQVRKKLINVLRIKALMVQVWC